MFGAAIETDGDDAGAGEHTFPDVALVKEERNDNMKWVGAAPDSYLIRIRERWRAELGGTSGA